MDQAIDVRQDFDKSAEIGDAYHFAGVNPPRQGGIGQFFDPFDGHAGAFAVVGGNEDRTVILDVNRCPGFFLDRADDFTTWADYGADLIDGNLDDDDPWGVTLQLGAYLWNDVEHFA